MQRAPFTGPARRRSRAPSSASPASTGASSAASPCCTKTTRTATGAAPILDRRRRREDEAAPALGPVERRALQRSRLAGLSPAARTGSGSCGRTATRSSSRGAGASPDGDRPFLDRLDLKTRKRRAPVPQRQDLVRVLPRVRRRDDQTFLTWHQSPDRSAERHAAHARRTAGSAVGEAGRGGLRLDVARGHAHPGSDARRCARSRSGS